MDMLSIARTLSSCWSPVFSVLWNARQSLALRQVWMIHLVREGSSSAATESAIDWAARQVMDWIYPSLDKACAQTWTHMHTCNHTYTEITVLLSAHICLHFTQSSTSHSTHTRSTCPHNTHLTTCLKTCVTFSRHLDSWDQRQWCIVSSCMDRGKTRQGGDSTLIDIRTFVRHLSAYFGSERWVSSNPYFEGEKRLGVDGRCLWCGGVAAAQLFLAYFLCFCGWTLKQILSKSSSINRFESHLDISSLIMMTRVNRLEDVKHSIKVAFYLLL